MRQSLRDMIWIPAYNLCFSILEYLPGRDYFATQLPIDKSIPYCSWFVIPYGFWYILLIGVGRDLFHKNRNAFHRYMIFLSSTFLCSVIIWIILPNGQDLRPISPQGIFAPIVSWIYHVDTNTNVFPSVHVLGSIGAALGAWDGLWICEKKKCCMIFMIALLICTSTVMIKQHSVLDICGAILLSAFVGAFVYRPKKTKSTISLVDTPHN